MIFEPNSTLMVDADGTNPGSYDQLITKDKMHFDGTLIVTVHSPYQPKNKDKLKVVNYYNSTGSFHKIVIVDASSPDCQTVNGDGEYDEQSFSAVMSVNSAGCNSASSSTSSSGSGSLSGGDIAALTLACALLVAVSAVAIYYGRRRKLAFLFKS